MKNLKLMCLALTFLMFTANIAFTQQQADLIVGEPDVYQDYILLNPDADSSIVKWEVVISKLYYDTVTKSVESSSLARVGTRKLDSYIRIDPVYRKKFKYLKVGVFGLDNNGSTIAVDKWVSSIPPGHINKEPRCWNTCVGKTYAFDVVINDRVNLQGVLQSGHTVSFRQHNTVEDGSAYIPEYRHMSFNEANTLDNNSFSQCADDLTETYCHYNINNYDDPDGTNFFIQDGIDGIKLIKRTGVTEDDQLKDKNGNDLTGTVYSIQKHLGEWQDENFTMSDELANEADIPCGNFMNSITAMINHANSNITLNNDLSCNGFGGGTYPWDGVIDEAEVINNIDVAWGSSNENPFDAIEEAKLDFSAVGANSTGVDWWPSDSISQIQIYNISKGVNEARKQKVITLYRDSLFESGGEPKYNNISLQDGLYNISFSFPRGYSFPVVLSKTNGDETNGYAHTNFLTVNIYPNPITSGNITVAMEADATINFDYKILDGQGTEIYNKDNVTINKDNTLDLFVPVNNFPSGTLVHVFEMSDGSSVSYNSIKN